MAFCSNYLSPLKSSVILFSIITKFLFPCKNGAKTPKKTILLTPVDLLINPSRTLRIASACFIFLPEKYLMISIPTSRESLDNVTYFSFDVNFKTNNSKIDENKFGVIHSKLSDKK